jgi:hypothetical protein
MQKVVGSSRISRFAEARSQSGFFAGGGEPLRRVHLCVFGVLALESQPVDPRL